MAVEINLLKTKHGVLDRYEKGENVDSVGPLHKKRTFSILLIVVLLGVLAGLQYGERLFSPIQGPLIKSLDYTLQLIPKLMQEMKGDEAKKDEDIVNVEDFFQIPDEGMKMTTPPEETSPPVSASKEEIISEPVKKEEPVKTVEKQISKPEVEPVVKERKTVPVKDVKKPIATPPSVAKIYLNAGSYLLKTNISKLRNAGKKRGFSVNVKTVYRMLPNYSLFVGNLMDAAQVTIVEKDLKKRSIPFTATKKTDGSFDIYTEYTPLNFQAEKQKEKLREAGYVVKVVKKIRKTPLNQILVGPLTVKDVEGVVSYLKKNGFSSQVVKE